MSRKKFNRQIPPFWAQYLHYMDFSRFLKNLSLATLARFHSIKFLFPILEIWACNVTSKSNYIFYIFGFVIDSQLPKCTKTHVKLHKNCLRLGVRQTVYMTENGIKCTQNMLTAETLPRTRRGSLQRSPRSTVVEDSSKQTQFFVRFGVTRTTLGGLLYILLQISSIGCERKSVKNYENWFTLLKSYCNTKGDVFIGPFYILLSNPVLTPLQKRSFQLAKMRKNTRFLR